MPVGASCFLLVLGASWCQLVPVGASWCQLVPVGAELVPVGACWCLLVVLGGACWCLLVLCVVVVVVVCVCVVGVFKIFGPLPRTPLRRTLPLDRPKFRSFFRLSRRKFHSFFSLWEVFSLNFGGVFEDRGAQMCTFGVGPPGLHTTTRELQTRHLSVPALQSNTTKIPRENPQREKKMRFPVGESKKTRNFGPPSPFGPHPSGLFFPPHPSGPPPTSGREREKKPLFLGSGPHPSGPHPFQVWAPQKQNWPNAVWPNSVNKNWPNSAK